MIGLSTIHPWTGTDHCLREKDGDGSQCVNDHTGCIWNDGHNTCMHPANNGKGAHDSPLAKVERKCLRCKVTGYGFKKLGPEHICPDCWWTCKVKYS